jgi:hypothetical protein
MADAAKTVFFDYNLHLALAQMSYPIAPDQLTDLISSDEEAKALFDRLVACMEAINVPFCSPGGSPQRYVLYALIARKFPNQARYTILEDIVPLWSNSDFMSTVDALLAKLEAASEV